MRHLITSWAIALVCIAVQGIGWAQSVPSGSYQQSCKNISVRDEVLSANCQDSDGKWEATQLRDYRTCGADIMNDNGALRCAGSGTAPAAGYPPGYQTGVPNGSYVQSCQDVHVDGDDLKARCQGSDGNWHNAKLDDYQKCRGDVVNENGKLRCVSGAYAPGYPAGVYRGPVGVVGTPYTQTCKDIKSHGDELQARCKNANGDWQNTSLHDYRKCHGQIVNQDGALRCVAGPTVGGALGNLPFGSYTQTCQNVRVSGDDLEAECSTNGGDTRHAKLDDYQKCRSDIINDDGHLRCSK
jgi:CVNH domain-containing protein